MDATLLTTASFWSDSAPFAAGGFAEGVPELPALRGHVMFETSGSSGAPKWIALSKTALLVSAEAVNHHLDVTAASFWGLALPPHHVGGFGVAARAFSAGCGFREFGRRWDAAAFTAWLADHRITHSSLVPTQVFDLVAAALHAPSSLRAIVVGGGRLDPETGAKARDLGWPVLASYGMTEAASQIATQRLSSLEGPYQSAPIPLLPIWRAEAAPDQRLRIEGPALFSGMLVREGCQWVFKARSSDWHETDDRVLLQDNDITLLGRLDTRVKVLGELVDLEMIERDLADLSDGRLPPGMFVVVAVPDTRAEHLLVPVFDASLDAAAIHEAVTSYGLLAPGFRRLQAMVKLAGFPRGPLGKPMRDAIFKRVVAGG